VIVFRIEISSIKCHNVSLIHRPSTLLIQTEGCLIVTIQSIFIQLVYVHLKIKLSFASYSVFEKSLTKYKTVIGRQFMPQAVHGVGPLKHTLASDRIG